ncbi:endonuclease domain-containing protein [Carboxylicivirga sp. RSCT41]|uniref:endonuclease domain-containing protein n=1 Tax=Carboxylicivirga agarovorans TaxID=3417570 RepID=UPI003D349E4D
MSQVHFDNLFYGASYKIRQRAKLLRNQMTAVEKKLWTRLCNRKLGGLKFRRQHPIDIFIVDFYCHEKKLVIELDGKIHSFNKEYDSGRTAELNQYGIVVIRFTNEEVKNNIRLVCKKIYKVCSNL